MSKILNTIKGFKNLLRMAEKSGGDINWFGQMLELSKNQGGENYIVTDPVLQNAWFHIFIKTIGENYTRAKMKIKDGDNEVLSGDIYDLFLKPNPFLKNASALWQAIASWITYHEAFITLGRGDYTNGVPDALWVWNPNEITQTLTKAGDDVAAWEWKKDNKSIVFLPSEVIHIKNWNIWDEKRGVPASNALREEINQDVKGKKSNTRLLDSDGIIPGILTSNNYLTEEQAKEWKERWRRQHGGYNKHHEIAVTGDGITYTPIGIKPMDMNFLGMTTWNRATYSAYFRVHLDALGIGTDGAPLSGERTTTGLRALWQLVLLPLGRMICDAFNADFFTRIGKPTLKFEYDTSEIPELQEDKDKKADREVKLIQIGRNTINEFREQAGEEPVQWGDTYYKPIGLVPYDEERPEPGTPMGEEQAEDETEDNDQDDQPEKQAAPIELKSLFPSRTKSLYTFAYRHKHWWTQINEFENIETRFEKQLKEWFYNQRSAILKALFEKSVTFTKGVDEVLFNSAFWADEEARLKNFSRENFMAMLESVAANVNVLFEDLGVGRTFDIYDSRALDLLNNRVNKGSLGKVTNTVRQQLIDTMQEAVKAGETEEERAVRIKSVFNAASNRAKTIARTELGGVINDSREEAFKEAGFKRHSWLSAKDNEVRTPDEHNDFNHLIDGETVEIGKKFSNGLTRPGDPQGEAGNVINCRCLTLPED